MLLALGLAACSGGGEADLTASLRDDGITLSQDPLAAGDVRLEATNDGSTIH